MTKPRFSSRLKIAFLNAMEALGAAASHLASNAKLRVQEINLESRRHEILTEFSLQAFEMWHNGVKLPKDLSDMFVELSELDDRLSILRAQKYAKVKAEGEIAEADGEDALPAQQAQAPAAATPPAEPAAEEAPAKASTAAEPKPKAAPKAPRKKLSAARKAAKPKPKDNAAKP